MYQRSLFSRDGIATPFAKFFDSFNTNNFTDHNGSILSTGFEIPQRENPKEQKNLRQVNNGMT